MSQSQLKDRHQVGRFAVVGVINTGIDFVLLFLLKSIGLPVITANLLSSTTAFIFSFAINRNYTFKGHSGGVVRQVVLFTAVTLFGLWILQSIVIHITEPVFRALFDNSTIGLLIAKIVATVASLTWNYILYATVVFRKSEAEISK